MEAITSAYFSLANSEWLPYALLALAFAMLLQSLFGAPATFDSEQSGKAPPAAEEEEEPDPPRDFTTEQLRKFNGVVTEDDKFNPDAGKIYICLKGTVYNVSAAANMYGPGGNYHLFAGRDASLALAKMSFEDQHLDNPDLSGISAVEMDQLEQWINKYKYEKEYPVVGKLSTPPARRPMTVEELAEFNGAGAVPEDRVDPPLYVGIKGKVYDVSYGGFDMYKPGTTYNIFAGKDSSRSLATMQFDEIKSRKIDDLTPEQLKTMDDWDIKFETKRFYPIVGDLTN
mmetsp:Transcript_83738/g.236512  ORF Transcript_83738/g.236512 Transcript_83738/m.236512 type:complete len:285 (+) Transcript_83738:144-998(+)